MGDSVLPWLLVVEIILPFVVLAVLLIVVLVRSKSRLKDAMRELIINVKDGEAVQKESTQRFLHENLGFEEAETEKISNELIKERKFFIRTLVSSLLNKDIEALSTLDEELSRITERYHALKPAGAPAAVEASEPMDDGEANEALQSEIEAKVAEIEDLKDKNKSLQQEVHITLTTLNNIFAEYSSMFGEEVTKKDMSVEQILTAMESFSGSKSSEEPGDPPADVSTPQEETETADDLQLSDEPEEEANPMASSLLDEPLEDVKPAVEDDDEPSWEDAFNESGDEMDKDKAD